MATSERSPQASADNDSEDPAHEAWPANAANGEAGDYHSPKEGPMKPELPTDASSLKQRKQALRRMQISMLPLQPREFQRLDDARWARQDPDVQAQYLGQFVVPFERKIIAHGMDASTVLAEAARITGRPVEELPLVGVIDPLLDMPR